MHYISVPRIVSAVRRFVNSVPNDVYAVSRNLTGHSITVNTVARCVNDVPSDVYVVSRTLTGHSITVYTVSRCVNGAPSDVYAVLRTLTSHSITVYTVARNVTGNFVSVDAHPIHVNDLNSVITTHGYDFLIRAKDFPAYISSFNFLFFTI